MDSSRDDEIFNKELQEIPEKLTEEIAHCQQVFENLLGKAFPISESKLLNYLEILHECNVLKIHSDPVCLFIQDEESKNLFESVIKLTSISNTYKTYILRLFLAHESADFQKFKEVQEDITMNKSMLFLK